MTTLDKLRNDLISDKAELAILEAKHADFKAEFKRRRQAFSDQLKKEMTAERGQIRQLVAIYKKKIDMAEELIKPNGVEPHDQMINDFINSNASQANTPTVASDQDGRIF